MKTKINDMGHRLTMADLNDPIVILLVNLSPHDPWQKLVGETIIMLQDSLLIE